MKKWMNTEENDKISSDYEPRFLPHDCSSVQIKWNAGVSALPQIYPLPLKKTHSGLPSINSSETDKSNRLQQVGLSPLLSLTNHTAERFLGSHWFKKSTKFLNMWRTDVGWGTGTTARDRITFQREAGGTDNRESKSPRANRIKGGIRGEMSVREEDATHQTRVDLACAQAGWGAASGWWYTVARTVGPMLFKTWVVWWEWAAPVQARITRMQISQLV